MRMPELCSSVSVDLSLVHALVGFVLQPSIELLYVAREISNTKIQSTKQDASSHSSALLRKCVAIATVSATVNINMDASTKPQRPSGIGAEFTSSI